MSLRGLIVGWSMAVLAAAVWTGIPHFKVTMTGFLPPHYGYSAYAIVPLLFLTPVRWLRWTALAALLASANRASWLGALAGWASAGGRRRAALAAILGVAAVLGGLLLKPAVVRGRTDNVRLQIWSTAWDVIVAHPEGVGRGKFCYAIAGREVTKAHSDVLQLAVEQGAGVTAFVLAAVILGLSVLPAGPWKQTLVALSAQSVIDNRLHHPACAVLYALAWIGAFCG